MPADQGGRALALLVLALSGCQSFGSLAVPHTIPDGSIRLGGAIDY